MILEVSWDNLWTLSFGLSQFLRHGSCLMCEWPLHTTRLRARDQGTLSIVIGGKGRADASSLHATLEGAT